MPAELLAYLTDHADRLRPELADLWSRQGRRTAGTWARSSVTTGKPRRSSWLGVSRPTPRRSRRPVRPRSRCRCMPIRGSVRNPGSRGPGTIPAAGRHPGAGRLEGSGTVPGPAGPGRLCAGRQVRAGRLRPRRQPTFHPRGTVPNRKPVLRPRSSPGGRVQRVRHRGRPGGQSARRGLRDAGPNAGPHRGGTGREPHRGNPS